MHPKTFSVSIEVNGKGKRLTIFADEFQLEDGFWIFDYFLFFVEEKPKNFILVRTLHVERSVPTLVYRKDRAVR